MKNLNIKNYQKQSGAVLVMALLMLFVLTLIGVSSINTTSMEEKMSGNTRNRHVAFQAAETAVRDAERDITTNINNPAAQFTATGGASGRYSLGDGPTTTDALNNSWWSGAAKTSSAASTTYGVKSSPIYTIEYLGETKQEEASDVNLFGGEEGQGGQGGIHTFRITVRGTGLTDNSVVVIQSHFGKRI